MNEINTFSELDISEKIKKAIYNMGITEPTPIQKKAIFPALMGLDILAQAPTGTGKTFAFGIPLSENIDPTLLTVQGVVVCPTRELAIQVASELEGLLLFEKKINVLAVYGGENIERQITFLNQKKPQIVVATPGRLNDHLKRKKIKLDNVKTIVLDEADEMLSMGFLPDIDLILGKAPFDSQKLLFSATLPAEILNIAKKYQKDNVFKVKIEAPKKELSPQISQYYLEMKNSMKTDVLKSLIDINSYKLCLVFCNTKKRVDELYEELTASGYSAEALHGDMKQQNRDRVMYKFKNDKINILIATDVAARGVDVEGIEAVFNYDAPLNPESYVHRIGRTGRADKSGVAYTFLSNREMFRLRDIMSYTKTNIIPMKRPSIEDALLKKADDLAKKIEEVIKNENLAAFSDKIDKMEGEGLNSKDIAAALMFMKLKPQKTNKVKTENKDKKTSKKENNNGTVRLFFNVGSLDKVRVRHLEELINDHPQLFGIKIKGTDIFDKFSFIDVSAKDAPDICDALNGMRFKGRELYVEVAEEKKTASRKKTRKK